MKQFFEDHGYSEGCDGCGCLAAGLKKKRPHSDKCRSRIYEEMKKTEKGRKHLEEAGNKLNEYYEEKLKKDHGDPNEKKQEADLKVTTDAIPEMDTTAAETAKQSQSSSSSDPVPPSGYREARGSVQKERSDDHEAERAAKRPKAEVNQTSSGATAPTAASGSTSSPPATTGGGGAAMKRSITDPWDADEAPEKTQKLNNICVGSGSSDKIGENSK